MLVPQKNKFIPNLNAVYISLQVSLRANIAKHTPKLWFTNLKIISLESPWYYYLGYWNLVCTSHTIVLPILVVILAFGANCCCHKFSFSSDRPCWVFILSAWFDAVSMVKSRSQGHDTSSCYLNKMYWLVCLGTSGTHHSWLMQEKVAKISSECSTKMLFLLVV